MGKSCLLTKIEIKWNQVLIVLFFVVIWICLYVFCRYVHPIGPWDGDDWNTVLTSMTRKYFPFPEPGAGYFFPQMIGTLGGYIAGFLIYPITGDYIMAFVAVGAFLMSTTITCSLVACYHLFNRFTENKLYASIGICFFLACAFLMFKTKPLSEHLYSQYNYCTIYFYGIPNYLASALSICLVVRYIFGPDFSLNIKTGMLLVALYCVNYSFLPAAFLLSAVSLCMIISTLYKFRKITLILRKCWPFLISLILFSVELYCEFIRTFGTGYFQAPTNFLLQLASSVQFFQSTVRQMHFFFIIFALASVVSALYIFLSNKTRHEQTEDDERFISIFVILFGALLFSSIFFVLFGALDFHHVYTGWSDFIRMDSMYALYFLAIILVSFCVVYIIVKKRQILVVTPLIVLLLSYSVFSPANYYKTSVYDTDCSLCIPNKQIEMMRSVVQEVRDRDRQGITSLIVHVPEWARGYAGGWCSYPVYRHHVTNNDFTIEFQYGENISKPYFE